MNKNLYRIVFNARRGIRMAVAETTCAQGKPASGNTQGPGVSASNRPPAPIDIAQAAIKFIVSAVALLGLPLLLQAQVVADRTAPGNQQPTILQTASGVTQVNIQAPSAAGVSRNTYSQFDVSRQGVVLNNSRTDSNTQIAGYVQGNPWLGGSGARVILNEVNSPNASQIRGYVEVAGQRAEVIIANPAGIAVNGGGFINASAVTLTTGTPVFNAGNLESFQVRSGSVVVDGDGLDTRTADYTNILARAAQINAGIWAKDIKVVSGANDISASNAANPSATAAPGAGTGTAPTFALDVAALGGMYAQKITLVGTESGLGVRNSGVIGATAGDVTVNSQGWLSNGGTISAVGSTRIQTQGDVTNTGEIVATDTTLIDTAATLRNQGLIDSGNTAGTSQTQIKATTVENLGTARIYGDTVSVAAITLTNDKGTTSSSTAAATLASRQGLNIGVDTLNNLNGANILSLGNMAIGASLDANGQATGSATTLTNSASTIEAQGTLRIHSATINNLNPLLEWEKDAGTPGVSGTVYFTTGGTFESKDGAVLAAGSGSLSGMSHGGYAYYKVIAYEAEETCTGGRNPICTPTGNMLPIYGYDKGAAQADSTSGAYTFDAFASYVQTDYKAVVTKSTPGRIASGSDMTLVASTGVVNDQSMIVSGGALTITAPSIDNRARTIQLDSVRNGTIYSWAQYDEGCGNIKGCNYNYQAYRPGAYQSNVASTQVLDTSVRQAASTVPLTAPGTTPSASTGINLPNSSLLRIQSDPSAPVLVQTDPRFTNYRSWLSSDYITSRISLDPSVTQKRLGDGFYEQRLINEQVAQLTGRRFLADYTSDQQQYQALMDSGLTFAQTYKLRPGIALTAEQMAVLTTDIVWLQQETVNLPDGTTTLALVPHVYAAVRPGDLNAQGGLLSGNTVAINSTGEVRNGGTILGRTVLEINANTINHLGGQIAANDVKLTARQDINVTGGSVIGQNSLIAVADKDINVTSTTASTQGGSGNYTYTRTGLDRMAGLYVAGPGTLLASASNDLNIIGATIQSAGNTQLSAANTVNLGTLQASQSNNVGAGDAKNHLLTSQTSDVGSKVGAGKDLTISAGQNIIAKAADLQAQGDVAIAAQGTVLLNAGQTRSSYDAVLTKSSSDLISTTTTRTQTQASAATAQVSSVQGQNVNIVAGQNLVSVGTQFKGTDSLRVEGKDTSTFYAATNVHQSTTTVQSTTTLSGLAALGDHLGLSQLVPLEKKERTDAIATSTSIGTRLLSDKKIEIGVGNKTELQGATVEAQQIAFVQTDPNKRGELILGGSIDTTQTSHSEKTETLGLYQEMKGKGSTTETLNQTQIKGNVSFDAALKITVQIPDTKGGQALKSQINALVTQTGGTGLEYLNQLAADPNIQWDKVALANEKWSYDQAGLTPAGAALLSIVVAAYMPGASGLFGTTTATGTTLGGVALTTTTAGVTTATFAGAALNAGFTALASQAAVAMVNNKGDLGKTLEQLGSEQSIKGLLTTMVTAGALNALGNSTLFNGQSGTAAAGSNGISTAQTAATFGDKLLKNITNNLAGSAIDAAINGKAFDEKMLTNALASALITTGMAQGANAIGDAKEHNDINGFTQKVAHAVLGCAGGAATAGNMSGCGAGAVGAVVGEMAAEYYMDSHKDNGKTFAENKADALAFAKVMSATAGVIVGGGGDNAAAVNIANTTGTNAAENNYLNHADALQLATLREKQMKGKLSAADLQEIKSLIKQDQDSNAALDRECANPSSAACGVELGKVKLAAASYNGTSTGFDSTGIVKNEREEAQTLAEKYSNRVNNATSYNAIAGAGNAVRDMVIGTVELAATAAAAVRGDKQAQAQLSDIVKAAGNFLENPVDHTQRAIADTLARANALEAAGQIDQAQQLRAELVTNGVLTVSGAGTLTIKVAQTTAKVVDGTLTAIAKGWETGKVLNAGEIAMSKGGNISAQQITRVGTPAALDEAQMSQLSKLDSLSKTAAGTVRETVANSYFESNGFKVLDGKCGVNCFDGVYTKGNQVIVNEVKPLNANGSIELNPSQPSGLPTQGTIQWVKDRAQALIDTKDPIKMETGYKILNAEKSGNLTTVVSGVNGNGMVIVKVKS